MIDHDVVGVVLFTMMACLTAILVSCTMYALVQIWAEILT